MNQEKNDRCQIEVTEFGDFDGWKKIIVKNKKTGEILQEIDTIDGEEIEFKEEDKKKYRMKIPKNLQGDEKLELFNTQTGNLIKTVDRAQELNVVQGISMLVPDKEVESWKAVLAPTKNLNEEEKSQVKQVIKEMVEANQSDLLSINQVAQTLELLLSTNQNVIPPNVIPPTFYKNINSAEEFGIARLLADKMNYMQKLLDDLIITRQGDTTTYVLQSEIKNSRGDSIKLEHHLQATTEEEAIKVGRLIKTKLEGVVLKAWLGCWAIANEKRNFLFSCPLTEIMNRCNPKRNVYFNTAEKADFYGNIRILENTKFVFTKSYKKKGKDQYESYELRLLEIHKHSGDKDEPPTNITVSVFNTTALQHEKLTFVGVGVKHKTLELHSDDTSLATVIQTRKNQMMNSEVLTISRDYLIERAGLSKTNRSNKSHANRLLLNKLKRLHDCGIILAVPEKITDTVVLKIR